MRPKFNLRATRFFAALPGRALIAFGLMINLAASVWAQPEPAPVMTAEPVNAKANLGQSASFTVRATGSLVKYQWTRDGAAIVGATNADFNVLVCESNLSGNYKVVVSNPGGSVTSIPAALTITPLAPGTLVEVWGDQIGSNETTLPMETQSGVVAVAPGFYHTLALKADGSVLAWGTSDPASPADYGQSTVPDAARSGVTAIAAGYFHSVALKTNGCVVAWGGNQYGQSTVSPEAQSGVTAISARNNHTVALKKDGTVLAWGYNAYGEVSGTPTLNPISATAIPVTLAGQTLRGVTAIAAGGSRMFAIIGEAPLLPTLNALLVENEFILNWTGATAGFVLQENSSLTNPNWIDVVGIPLLTNLHKQVLPFPRIGNRFYRLQSRSPGNDPDL